ncbi:hypothetical protein VTN96DRAFT_6436 [Rasamsonia emersonii]
MPEKRKTPSSSDPGNDSPYAKRSRPQTLYADAAAAVDDVDADVDGDDDDQEEGVGVGGRGGGGLLASSLKYARVRPRSDPVYGQKSAFPGLDDANAADELFYGPAEDGLEYLRMVRSEANSLPTLFVAPKPTTTEAAISKEVARTGGGAADEEGELQREEQEPSGYYHDGVYMAGIPGGEEVDDEEDEGGGEVEGEEEEDAQASYYNLLRHRFLLLRSTLRCSPPASAIAALDDSHPISLPYSVKSARSEWRRLLITTDPQMVQLACMDMNSVFGALKIVARMLSDSVKTRDAMRIRRIGAWAWGLLGRCRDVGQLASEEVSELRDLGKRAVKILSKLREEESAKRVGDDRDEHRRGEGDSDSDEGQTRVQAEKETGVVREPPSDSISPQADQQPVVETTEATQTSHNSSSAPAAESTAPASEQPEGADADADLEAAKARLQARLLQVSPTTEDSREKSTSFSVEGEEEDERQSRASKSSLDLDDAAKHTRAMLDMIITIVGEFYGQRDLLDARDVW